MALGVFGALAVIIGTVVAVGAVRAGHVERRNVLVIMTDDQTLESMRVMTHTRKWLGDGGTTFDQFYASFPLCCPSRATYYSGRYAHNTGVQDNIPPFGGAKRFTPMENDSLAVWLHEAGYRTASVGKYLNGWGADGNIAPPPGWDHWFGLIDPTTYDYFGYHVSVNGKERVYGSTEADYQTDVLGQEVVDTIDRFHTAGQPWFISFTPLAPHVAGREGEQRFWAVPEPAPRHRDAFANEPMPQWPAFDEADVSTKPDFVRNSNPLDDNMKSAIASNYRREMETLLAVDEWVDKIVQKVQQVGELDNTIIMFTSDNGLLHGQHRGPLNKVWLYEESSHVPLLVRGPGFPAGAHASQPTVNVDLAPTILAAAGAAPSVALDGRNLAPLASDPTLSVNRSILLENWTGGRPQSQALRGGEWFYAEHRGGARELYDLVDDPDQLRNLVDDPAYASVVAALQPRLGVLENCAGATCEDSDASRGG